MGKQSFFTPAVLHPAVLKAKTQLQSDESMTHLQEVTICAEMAGETKH